MTYPFTRVLHETPNSNPVCSVPIQLGNWSTTPSRTHYYYGSSDVTRTLTSLMFVVSAREIKDRARRRRDRGWRGPRRGTKKEWRRRQVRLIASQHRVGSFGTSGCPESPSRDIATSRIGFIIFSLNSLRLSKLIPKILRGIFCTRNLGIFCINSLVLLYDARGDNSAGPRRTLHFEALHREDGKPKTSIFQTVYMQGSFSLSLDLILTEGTLAVPATV